MKKARERKKTTTRHAEPSEAFKEIPEVDFKARVRRNPYAARIAKEGGTGPEGAPLRGAPYLGLSVPESEGVPGSQTWILLG